MDAVGEEYRPALKILMQRWYSDTFIWTQQSNFSGKQCSLDMDHLHYWRSIRIQIYEPASNLYLSIIFVWFTMHIYDQCPSNPIWFVLNLSKINNIKFTDFYRKRGTIFLYYQTVRRKGIIAKKGNIIIMAKLPLI